MIASHVWHLGFFALGAERLAAGRFDMASDSFAPTHALDLYMRAPGRQMDFLRPGCQSARAGFRAGSLAQIWCSAELRASETCRCALA